VAKLLRLRLLRERATLTQEELAAKSGVSRGTIARLERGEDSLGATVRKLASALEVTPADLMGPLEEQEKYTAAGVVPAA
jgi:transcriptional regulator with XRE-family HTH domain